eukprot:gnl/TRDRNA2_/TRDRNA2_163275_c0_seq1.p1 gnl/TRDRNA2_/TRDRNA2_163275_c0~~gnl/TRDRNA2_/TRDRNA2_163275_c0_seq1.p1  ORF type:complete len:200 (+),score=31.63 gnl/TRDRNA2_/TRDRNA2_163275_c0_seq1:52-651(+)
MAHRTEQQHFVDSSTERKYGSKPDHIPPSDVLSDTTAPKNSFMTYRNGEREYVSEDALVGKHVGLLFGANVSPCWGFVRALSKVYKAVVPEYPFEVVYVSADKSFREYNRFVRSMPWLSVPFRDNSALFAKYGVPFDLRGWPTLVVVAPDDKVVFEDACPIVRQCVAESKLTAFGSLLKATKGEKFRTRGRFHALFDPW